MYDLDFFFIVSAFAIPIFVKLDLSTILMRCI